MKWVNNVLFKDFCRIWRDRFTITDACLASEMKLLFSLEHCLCIQGHQVSIFTIARSFLESHDRTGIINDRQLLALL